MSVASNVKLKALETPGRSKTVCQILQSHRELVEAACWKLVLITAQNLPSTSDSGQCGHQVFCGIQQSPPQAVTCQ